MSSMLIDPSIFTSNMARGLRANSPYFSGRHHLVNPCHPHPAERAPISPSMPKGKGKSSPFFPTSPPPTPSTPKSASTRRPSRPSSSPYFRPAADPAPLPTRADWARVAALAPPTSVVRQPVHLPRYTPLQSPHALVQEELYANPWALLVATIFLNKTRGDVAKPKLLEFLEKWPCPESAGWCGREGLP
ncbi:hypothetical protein BDK51DRAFT_52837 [Blyttiomyces helicus]|uniref:HhH-GPD domain-containing protein n=1 Tax=Blyttiomyces helicus TaxID=388810 RepID=A0A4P9VWA2_9FUNG|nr:hypothetical protein BDK51DRAFT_52837 [Blyttiomyces helicus]|eukprot:RKO83979.1 hypothetical protein BDK51DRAFT_52837 [Blyttiomyces helicus]